MNDAIPSGASPNVAPEQAAEDAAYRGFLFADLRGYTAFVEAHGSTAAADLLDAYRAMVREQVARHAGAEIRTEGDSFYVVFTSARHAVACGMAIVAAAEAETRDHRERPIRVGIGINAGETVEREEGFVGAAVNIAARICAEARAGEVLITPTVRDAVGGGAGVRFEPRGSRRLKGISRPIPLFAVEPEGAPPRLGPRRLRAPMPVLAIGAVVVAALLAGWVGLSLGAFGVALTSASPPASSVQPSALGNVASATPRASVEAGPSADAYPDAAETMLLERLDENIAPHCERADEDDRPVLSIDAQTARAFGITLEERVAAHTGVACEIPSIAAPDSFHLWETRRIIDFRSVDVPEALILNRVGADGIPLGDCSDGSPAYGRWEIGDVGGWFLCREVYGDAVIEWSYDGRALYGTASRRDGDLDSLLRWWAAEARLLAP